MSHSYPFGGLRRISQQFSPTQQFATIEIYAGVRFETSIWRIAILSFDMTTDTNLISPKLAVGVLGLTINPLDEKHESTVESFEGRDIDTQGYVDLVWCFQNSPDKCNTRFAVTSSYDPPFDAVLGRKDTIQVEVGKRPSFFRNIRKYCCNR
ncbi:hypothetical protein AOQ84DRAFT_356315 [Glonium stellatum]|uniref:Uncharacterized protein n=1 Tax=Glonium stellatum TaxID=574774 RepID=A0A8E2ETL5_9PEZI|nr:hypothetical protein AOQ84DRAFT_356315 [Glonium stellatum]